MHVRSKDCRISSPRCRASQPRGHVMRRQFRVASASSRWNNCVHYSYLYVHRLRSPLYSHGGFPWREPECRRPSAEDRRTSPSVRWTKLAQSGLRLSAVCGRKPKSAQRICRPKTRSCSRWPMLARPNGIAHMSPGSSSNFFWCRTTPGYGIFDERFPFLFNSYYVAAGPRHARPQRGLITRPNGAEVAAYRAHVDAAVERLIETGAGRQKRSASSRSSRSDCITSSSTRNCCSPISCTHSRRILPTRSTTPNGSLRARRWGRAVTLMCPRACMRSATMARASASTTRRRFTTSSFRACASPGISSLTPSGSNSSPPAVTRRRRFGCPTAGPRCRTKTGRRPAIGGRRTAPGMS